MTFRSSALVLLFAAFSFAVALPAGAQFGIAAGLNFDSIDDINLEADDGRSTFDQATGYHAGVFYDLGVGPLGVRIGLFYRDLGTIDVEGVAEPVEVNLSMIEAGVDLRYTILAVPKASPYLLVGPVVSLPRSDSEGGGAFEKSYDDALESLMVSGVVGAGVSLNLGTIAVMPEIRYAVGLSGLTGKEFEIGGITYRIEKTQKVKSVQLRLGIRF
jgi:hypothetical protein